MAVYLTPAKIGLLVLIELYLKGFVPTNSTIPILSFITSHLLPSSAPKKHLRTAGMSTDNDTSQPFIIQIQDFRKVLIVHPSAAGIPGRTLWDAFLQKLWEIDSLDALHVFFDSRSALLAKSKEELQKAAEAGSSPPPPPDDSVVLLSRTSPFGAFVRRAQLEFTRLKFHGALALWKLLIVYRQVTLAQWQKRHPGAGVWSFDVALEDGDEEWGPEASERLAAIAYGGNDNLGEHVSEVMVSSDDIEKLLEFQIERMQKLGTRVPDDVQIQIKGMTDSEVAMPSISHYVRFLDAWKAGDYTTSFDSLHRFFDYTMQNRDRLFYQYALLNLAVLQADFGCYHEAVAAMQETVSTARENKDMSCLNFSLSWLYHFGKAHPDVITGSDRTNMLGTEREGLAFLRIKAKESGMWSLWSSSLLSEAKLGLANGESVATAFENILRSSHLTITKNMMSSVGAQHMLQSSLWSRLGNTYLSSYYCDIFLRCHARSAPFDDVLRFTCRAAYILTQKGKYDEALDMLEALDEESLRPLKASQYWLRFRGILRLKRELHKNNLDDAEGLLHQLLQTQTGDADLSFELDTLHIDFLTRRGDLSAAFAKIETIFTNQKQHPQDLFFRVRLLILKAQLLKRCGRPERGFTVAVRAATTAHRARLLPLLWSALCSVAHILNALSEFATAVTLLTSILPRAIECEDSAATALLFSHLVDAHVGAAGQAGGAGGSGKAGTGDTAAQANRAEVAADNRSSKSKRSVNKGAEISGSGASNRGSSSNSSNSSSHSGARSRTEHLTRALEALDRAFAEFSAVEDILGMREMTAKKAVVLRYMGDVALADDCVMKYLDLGSVERDGDGDGGGDQDGDEMGG